jgi:hypothetical protein
VHFGDAVDELGEVVLVLLLGVVVLLAVWVGAGLLLWGGTMAR